MNNDTSLINNKIDDNDTSYNEGNNFPFELVPNRETRRKEMKKKYYNPHELNIGRISASNVNKDFCQKEKKKNFNKFIKGKVK